MKKLLTIGLIGLFSSIAPVQAATPLMSAEWGEAACDAWNNMVIYPRHRLQQQVRNRSSGDLLSAPAATREPRG